MATGVALLAGVGRATSIGWFSPRRESRGCSPMAQWVEAGQRLDSSVLCIFRRHSMELERIVSSALLAFVQAHLPEADLR